MPHSNRIVLFILFAVHISLPINATHNDNPYDSFYVEASHQSEISIQEHRILSDKQMEEIASILASSPEEAQYIINHLQNPNSFPNSEDYRTAIFVGKPGSDTTKTALAIAYTMAQEGWEYRFISSTSLLSKRPNQTAIRLREELNTIKQSGKPTILIIDGLNRLLETGESSQREAGLTGTTLWTFMDNQNGNTKFFLIGTMNRVNKLPKQYKDRILFDFIQFPLKN